MTIWGARAPLESPTTKLDCCRWPQILLKTCFVCCHCSEGISISLPLCMGATIYLYRASSGVQAFTHLSSPCTGKELEKISVEKGVKVYQYIDDILTGGDWDYVE